MPQPFEKMAYKLDFSLIPACDTARIKRIVFLTRFEGWNLEKHLVLEVAELILLKSWL